VSSALTPPGLLGRDFGHIQVPAEIDPVTGMPLEPNSLDSFGNLEVSPPCTVGGVSYRFGRIYYGDGGPGGRRMDENLRNFLARQRVRSTDPEPLQSPVTFNSDWLVVGHVDEFMSTVPDPTGTEGWKVVFAEPAFGVGLLQTSVGANLRIPRYRKYNFRGPPFYRVETVGELLGRLVGDREPLDYPYDAITIRRLNGGDPMHTGEIPPILATIKSEVMSAFGRVEEDFIPAPVIFNRLNEFPTQFADAIVPDLANGSVYPGFYIAPDPFLHEEPGAAEEDTNLNYFLDPGEDLNHDGMLSTENDFFQETFAAAMGGTIVRYIDDWYVYHLKIGEVHCGANELRAIPVAPNAPKWWEAMPPSP